jgi:mannan endo-1,4-beta-mannosidase
MKRAALATLGLPFAAAAAFGGLLLATHHLTVPPLSPSAPLPGSARAAAFGPCEDDSVAGPYIGIAINPQITAHVTAFRRATGVHVRLVEFFNPFNEPFQRWEAQQAVALGALPLIQLNPRNISLAKIAGGGYDGQIRHYADAVRSFGCRVVISFGHEMNGWWYSWGLPDTTPAIFIAAWRHIHNVFAGEGVKNVIWSWDPSHLYQRFRNNSASPASRWYPGDRYVDWIGIDGYLGQGQTFKGVFGHQLRNIRGVTNKPIYIAETGVAGGPSQSWQITGLFAALRKYRLMGLVWFDLNRKQPWRLEGRPAGIAAYRKAVTKLYTAESRRVAPG